MHKQKTIIKTTIMDETFIAEKMTLENDLRIIKTESKGLDLFNIMIPFNGTSIYTVAAIFEIAMQYPDPDVFKKTFHALAKQNQGSEQVYQQN
jgi:hydroxymethylpyrimidine pyrophosphatase-like HAD family hydrolase